MCRSAGRLVSHVQILPRLCIDYLELILEPVLELAELGRADPGGKVVGN